MHTTVLIAQSSLLDYVNDLLRHAKALVRCVHMRPPNSHTNRQIAHSN